MELLKCHVLGFGIQSFVNHTFLSNVLHHSNSLLLGEERVLNLLLLDVTLPLPDLAEVCRLLGIIILISIILLIVSSFIFITGGRLNVAAPLVAFGVEVAALTFLLLIIFISRHLLI